MSKYDRLFKFLSKTEQEKVTLTFEEIENILLKRLPDSAYNLEQWWSNSIIHTQAKSWIMAGYKTQKPKDTMYDRRIVFVKDKMGPLAEAEERGIKIGRQEEKIDMVRNMKLNNLDIDIIASVTGFSLDEIEIIK